MLVDSEQQQRLAGWLGNPGAINLWQPNDISFHASQLLEIEVEKVI